MNTLQFDINLALVLAHSMVYDTNEQWAPVRDARCEDEDAPDPAKSTAKTMEAYLKFLPDFMRQQIKWQPELEASRINTAERFNPRWTALQTDLYQDFAPRLAETARAIDAANRMTGAEVDSQVLAGPGRESFRAVQEMLKESDPEFFALREQTAGKIGELMGGGLTGSEEEAIERKLARDRVTSGIGTPTPANTVAEAMKFGDAARNRQMQGVAAATSFLPSSRTGFDPTSVALGRPSINTGDSKFLGVQQPASAEQSANNFFNQIAGFRNTQMEIDAQKRDWIDRVNEGFSSVNI